MKNTQAWGFLVSRNQYLDYRTIVAPNFMCEAGASSILARAAEGDLTEKGFALYREVHKSKVGNLTLVFRVIEATAEDTGISGNGILKDSFGREIYLIEGIVFKELVPDILVTQKYLENNHKYVINFYRDFWECTVSNSAMPSEPFTLFIDKNSSQVLKYNKLKKFNLEDNQKVNTEKIIFTESNLSVHKNKLWRCIHKKEFKPEVSSVAFLPNGDLLAIRYNLKHQKIAVFNWRENKKIFKFRGTYIEVGSYLTPVVINHTGQFIASAMIEGWDKNIVKLWNINTQEVKNLGEHGWTGGSRVKAVAFSPDSKILASGGGNKIIRLWDVKEEGLELDKITGHDSEVRCLIISHDGEVLVSGDGDGIIKFWNLRTRREIRTIEASSSPINSLAFSSDSQTLVSGSDDCMIKLWNTNTGKEICKLGQHLAPVNSVTFSPDSSLLASGSDDCKIKIWELKSKSAISELSGHSKPVTSVAFSPDGQTLVSGSKDGTIRIWQP